MIVDLLIPTKDKNLKRAWAKLPEFVHLRFGCITHVYPADEMFELAGGDFYTLCIAIDDVMEQTNNTTEIQWTYVEACYDLLVQSPEWQDKDYRYDPPFSSEELR